MVVCSSIVRSADFALQFSQAAGVTEWEIDRHRDPFPAFLGDCLGLRLQLLSNKTVEQSDILKPAAIVMLEQIAQDGTSGLLVGVNANRQRTAIGSHGRCSP